MLHIRVINKFIINLEIRGGHPVLVNYETFLSSLFSIAPPNYFSVQTVDKILWITPCTFY